MIDVPPAHPTPTNESAPLSSLLAAAVDTEISVDRPRRFARRSTVCALLEWEGWQPGPLAEAA